MSGRSAGGELDRFQELLTGALDGELTPAEEREFAKLLAESPARQKEWEELKKVKELTMKVRFANPPEEVWDKYWTGTYRRIERGVGWILVSLGTMVLLGYGGFHAVKAIVEDDQMPWYIRTPILALMFGGIILFVSVVRERLFTAKTDKYKEIQR